MSHSGIKNAGKIPALKANQETIHVLLLEDAAIDGKLIQDLLTRQSRYIFHVSWVKSLLEAKTFLQKMIVDVILVDLNVLDSKGLVTFTQLYQQAPNIPIIIFTGKKDDDLAMEAMRLGAQDYLVKGRVNQDSLIKAIYYATERKKAQETIAENEELFRNLSETISAGILILCDRKLVYANSAFEEMTGYKATELQKLHWQQIIHPQYQPQQHPFQNMSLSNLFEEHAELRILTKGGIDRWLEFTTRRIKYRGSPATLITLFDVTDRKKQEFQLKIAKQAAEQASHAKSTFLANMSHEFRTPLNAIIGYSELMFDEAVDKKLEKFVKDLQKVQTSAHHLRQMIDAVLDISRLESGKVDIQLDTIDIASLMEEIKKTITPLVTKNGNTLHLAYPDDVGTMVTDAFKLERILQNLLENATKFTKNGELSFSATREFNNFEETLLFRISDTGIGIAVDNPISLVEPFAVADSSSTRAYDGVGLGLTIAWRFCRLLDGHMWVESKVNEGTTFTLQFPAIKKI